jgi:hypothetical protein
MGFHVSGKLRPETAKQPSFTGVRIEALFDRKAALTPSRVSALSDDAGNFTLVFPDQQEIASKTVKFAVSSPAGRILREMEVMTADLGETITIEVQAFDAGPFDKPAPKVNTPQSVAVDAVFKTDAALRRTITENLKSLRGESEAVAARVEKAWKFHPSQLSTEDLAKRHYVAPGSDPGEVLETVIMSGVDVLRSAKTERALILRNSPELKKLIKNNQERGDSLHGVVELGPLIEFIQRRGAGPIQGAELTSTPYSAEAEAEAILGAIDHKDGAPVAPQQALTSKALEAEDLVKKTVNKQMESATGPEAELAYGKIPNRADEDQAQKTILQSFEPRKGPTDVTSYHDFHTLQIAFEHVWTEIFDGQLESLGRELYAKYVELKDFGGSSAPDPTISTLADLKRLIEEVKTLTNFTEGAMPGDRQGSGDTSTQTKPSDPKEWTDFVKNLVPPDPASRLTADFIELIINEAKKLGIKERLSWEQLLQGAPLSRPQDKIVAQIEHNVAGAGKVEIKLRRHPGQRWRGIEFQQFDPRIGPNPFYRAMITNNSNDPVSQYPGGPPNDDGPIVLDMSQLNSGVLEFDSVDGAPSEHKSGRYLLFSLGEVLTDRTRVTFDWIEA